MRLHVQWGWGVNAFGWTLVTSVHYLFVHQSNSLLKTEKEITASIGKVSCLDVNSKYWTLKLAPSHNTFFLFCFLSVLLPMQFLYRYWFVYQIKIYVVYWENKGWYIQFQHLRLAQGHLIAETLEFWFYLLSQAQNSTLLVYIMWWFIHCALKDWMLLAKFSLILDLLLNKMKVLSK